MAELDLEGTSSFTLHSGRSLDFGISLIRVLRSALALTKSVTLTELLTLSEL